MKRGFLNKASKKSTGAPVESAKKIPEDAAVAIVKRASSNQAETSSGDPTTESLLSRYPVPVSAQGKAALQPITNLLASNKGLLNSMYVAKFPLPSLLQPNEPIAAALLYEGTREALRALPNFMKTPFKSIDWPCVVNDIPNMGKGLLARETIRPGTLILNERAVAIMPTALPYFHGQSLMTPDELQQQLVSQLSDNDRRMMYSLHNCKGSSVPEARGIFDTNLLGIGKLTGPFTGEHGALFRDISRINHSCSPNANYDFDIDSLSMSIHATHTIEKGEQIFIAYEARHHSRKERQSQLLAKYSFTCTCPSCSLPQRESMMSDIRRNLIYKEDQKTEDEYSLTSWVSDKSLPDDYPIKASKRIIDMLEEESFVEPLGMFHCKRLCVVYCMLGDKESVIRWATKGLALAVALRSGEEEKKEWKGVIQVPEKSMFWGMRLRSLRG